MILVIIFIFVGVTTYALIEIHRNKKNFPVGSQHIIDSIEYANSEYAKSLSTPVKADVSDSSEESASVYYSAFDEFGYDQYSAIRCATRNKMTIVTSEICGCFFCLEIYPPGAVTEWTDDGETAICPKCGLGNVVIGSSSGLPVNKEFLSLVGDHWF